MNCRDDKGGIDAAQQVNACCVLKGASAGVTDDAALWIHTHEALTCYSASFTSQDTLVSQITLLNARL